MKTAPETRTEMKSKRPGRDESPEPAEITRLLSRVAGGDHDARNELASLVHPILVDMAGRLMSQQPPGHTLEATALAHEAWMRIEAYQDGRLENRRAFYSVAGTAMRSVLVDHVRAKRSRKRSPTGERVLLDSLVAAYSDDHDLLDLDEALTLLQQKDARMVRIVELRFFLGLTFKEAAEVLGVSESTVYRDWCFVQSWIADRLG